MAKDFFGTEFNVGDIVSCLKKGSSTSYLVYGVVLKTSNKSSVVFCSNKGELQQLRDEFEEWLKQNKYDVKGKVKEYGCNIHRKNNLGIVKHPLAVGYKL